VCGGVQCFLGGWWYLCWVLDGGVFELPAGKKGGVFWWWWVRGFSFWVLQMWGGGGVLVGFYFWGDLGISVFLRLVVGVSLIFGLWFWSPVGFLCGCGSVVSWEGGDGVGVFCGFGGRCVGLWFVFLGLFLLCTGFQRVFLVGLGGGFQTPLLGVFLLGGCPGVGFLGFLGNLVLVFGVYFARGGFPPRSVWPRGGWGRFGGVGAPTQAASAASTSLFESTSLNLRGC